MFEVIPDNINKGIKPDNGWQGDYGNESHEYDKCEQFYSLFAALFSEHSRFVDDLHSQEVDILRCPPSLL
jgi:hypothetical protein